MQRLSDQDLFYKIKSMNIHEQEEALTYLYQQLYKKVVAFIVKNNGSEIDAEDIFQDGLLAFMKMVKQDKIEVGVKVEAYIFSICRNLWYKKLQKAKREVALSDDFETVEVEEIKLQKIISKEKSVLLKEILESLGGSCSEILIAFYYEQLSMEEIVKKMDLSSVQVAKNKKYLCMKKLQKLVKESSFYKSMLRK